MDEKPKDEQPTQPHPSPDGTAAEPTTIPIPKRRDFFRDLAKVSKSKPKRSKDGG